MLGAVDGKFKHGQVAQVPTRVSRAPLSVLAQVLRGLEASSSGFACPVQLRVVASVFRVSITSSSQSKLQSLILVKREMRLNSFLCLPLVLSLVLTLWRNTAVEKLGT